MAAMTWRRIRESHRREERWNWAAIVGVVLVATGLGIAGLTNAARPSGLISATGAMVFACALRPTRTVIGIAALFMVQAVVADTWGPPWVNHALLAVPAVCIFVWWQVVRAHVRF